MGLDYYGQFVAVTASAFLIQRLADFPSETLIFLGDKQQLLMRSGALQACFFVIAAGVSTFSSYQIDLVFLLGLQCSSVAFALVLSSRSDRLTFIYLSSFFMAYVAALVLALSAGKSLAFAISIPNYLALIWIPVVLRLPTLASININDNCCPPSDRIADILMRVAAGSFVAFSTIGLASMATSDRSTDTAQIRLLGTALGFAAFLLPWPLKSLVGILQTANPQTIAHLRQYLRGTRFLAVLLIAASLPQQSASKYLACAGVSLLFVNFLVIERWNVAHGRLSNLARIALLATATAFASFKLLPADSDPISRSSIAILGGTAVYAALSCRSGPSVGISRQVAAETSWLSLAGALALFGSQRLAWL